MARYYGTIRGSARTIGRAGTKNSGIVSIVSADYVDILVRVTYNQKEEKDEITVIRKERVLVNDRTEWKETVIYTEKV